MLGGRADSSRGESGITCTKAASAGRSRATGQTLSGDTAPLRASWGEALQSRDSVGNTTTVSHGSGHHAMMLAERSEAQMEYTGYSARVVFDEDAGVLFGGVDGLRDVQPEVDDEGATAVYEPQLDRP